MGDDPTDFSASRAAALGVLGLQAGGLPDDEAAAIIAGGRRVDLAVVRKQLMPSAALYVLATPLLARLVQRRALTNAEAQLLAELDGARTVKGLIDGGIHDASAVARLLWAFATSGAATLRANPPEDDAHPRARAVAEAREHLRARAARVRRVSAYEVLEVAEDASAEEVEGAATQLAERFAPELFAALDLGDLAPVVEPMWQQILKARETLLTPRLRRQHDAQIANDAADDSVRLRRRIDESEAEAAFARGQRALAEGDAFRAVSELAAASRRRPDDPDYECYAAWARVCADAARGQTREAAARRERPAAERAMRGRRPRPRALFALGLLCEAAGALEAARAHLRAALACDPRLVSARQALARLGG